MKSEKKKVKWNSDVEEFKTQAAWGGAQRDMVVVRAKLGCKHDVSEFYSPPRVVKMARKLGMKGGVSLDLTVPASDGFIWDFSRKHCMDMAMEIINDEKPLFLMLSPECTQYSNIYKTSICARLRARPRLRQPGAKETFTYSSVLPLPGGRWRAEGTLCTNT